MKRMFPLATLTLALASATAFSTAGFAQTQPEPPCAPGAACEMPTGPMGGNGPMDGNGPMGGDGPMDGMMGDRMGRGAGPMFDFDTLDADKDGKVTQAEIDAPRQARLEALDADGNGQIGAPELSAMYMAGMKARADQRAAAMVERFDSNADGQISAAEFAAGPRPMNMIDRLDTDKDGAVSRAEADAAQERMQDRRGDRHHGGRRDGGKHGWFGRD